MVDQIDADQATPPLDEPATKRRPSVLPVVEHLTPEERSAAGKAARAAVSRSSHGEWAPAPDRPDPVDLLLQQDESRVPELVPIRHGRMSESAFTFFRGGALLMASDLAPHPRTSLEVQLCGDAHLSNFGIYAAPDRHLVFSVNDFDETLPGPFEWDIKRLVASLAVAGRSREFSDTERGAVIAACSQAYRLAMREFAQMNTLDLWYLRLDVEQVMSRFVAQATKAQLKNLDRILSKARSKTSLKAVAKLTHEVDGELRFLNDAPLVVPVDDLLTDDTAAEMVERFHQMLREYRATLATDRQGLLERYRYVDLARKVVGVGSVGQRAFILLLVGRDNDDPLMMQFKEAQQSVLERYLGPSEYERSGQRVVAGQRMMQSATDILLGWFHGTGLDGVDRDFYARQLWDQKGSAVIEWMEPTGMAIYGQLCGWTLARAHARSGDAIAIARYLGRSGSFDRAMIRFAEAYADQNERDYATFMAAIADGRIEAVVE
jgi:uncharacterized protein (DUF2252 family)